jgi:hypothetical protein
MNHNKRRKPMDVARMPEPGATEGTSRQDLLSIYEQTKTIMIGADVLWFQPGTHTTDAIQLAADAELTVVAGRCMGATHGELGSDRDQLGPFARLNLRSHIEGEQVPNGTRLSHREDLYPPDPPFGGCLYPG